MIKHITAIFLLLVSVPAFSQSVGGGFKIGANYTGILGDEVSENDFFDRKLGLHGGLVVDFGVSQKVSIKTEFLYSSKGFEYNDVEQQGPGYIYTFEGKETFHCIDIPVLVNAKVGQVFFEAGPFFSFLVNRDREVTETRKFPFGTVTNIERNSSVSEGFNFFDYGLAAGLGYQFQSRFNFGVRYNASFRHLQKDENANYDFPKDARSSVFQLSIGYLFYDHQP